MSWFAVDGEPRVPTERLRSGRRILQALVLRPEPLSLHELFAIGWPGERATAESMQNRVYVAITRLRKLGLNGCIVSTEGGWQIAPEVDLVVETSRG